MRKMILLAAMTAIAALMLAATPALAQQGPPDKVTICHTPPPNDFTLEVPPQAVPGHLGHGDYLGECEDDGNGNGDGRDNDRDFRDFCRIFDCRDNDNNNVVPAFEITQDFDQEAESGDIDQSFDVSQTGDNSNQTVGIQGVANTGNAQNQIGVIDAAGNFGDFNNDNNDVVFVDDFCDFGDFNGDGICEDFNNRDDFCEDFNGNSFCEDLEDFCEDSNRDNICDFFFDDFDRFNDNDLFFFDDDNRFFANGDNDGDIEFEDVGSTITVSPTNTTSSDQQVNQAATAFGK